RGIVQFPERFRHTDGRLAGRVSLGVCRRSGSELLRISRRVAEGLPGPWEHRRLAAGQGTVPGSAEVHVFASAAVEAAYLADQLRRAHLLDGLPWSEMAVVVRSAVSLGALRNERGVDPAEKHAPLATALADDTLLDRLPEHVARPALRVAGVLGAGRVALAGGGTVEDVLWAMWQRSGLAGRWARASAAGGHAG